jgi:hypothetical protein
MVGHPSQMVSLGLLVQKIVGEEIAIISPPLKIQARFIAPHANPYQTF